MSKVTSLFVISVVLFFSLTFAARTMPLNARHETESAEVEESCGGVGEEECLMRRTLEANLDYIYTNKTVPPPAGV
ncbi:hypothetical protein Scep_001220 [Stephania cephalantha]|uniref:Phytosulfokine n=1 Tax=Stephania cephalantha TaxID=152367 RepID=A0AAP0Q4U9_9MAGN